MAHTIRRRRRAGLVLVLSGLFALAGAITTPAAADQPVDPGNSENAPGQTGDKPAGNNGVLKVDGIAVDEPGGGPEGAPGRSHRDNEPHVSCQFNLDWYGFEQGAGTSEVTFELWGPNKGYELTPSPAGSVGGDQQSNADDQDDTERYDLASALAAADAQPGIDPNDQQGWLVKVTVETDGLSQGADVKHKVFWVDDDCGTTQNPGCPTCTSLLLGVEVTTTTTTTTTVPPTTAAPTTAPPETTVAVSVLGVQLARTGAGTQVLLTTAGLLLLAGGTALLAGKREAPAAG